MCAGSFASARQTGARDPQSAVSRDRSGERFGRDGWVVPKRSWLLIGWYEPDEFCTFNSSTGGASLAPPRTIRIGYPTAPVQAGCRAIRRRL